VLVSVVLGLGLTPLAAFGSWTTGGAGSASATAGTLGTPGTPAISVTSPNATLS
jgi:hypothetical protein